MFLKNKVKLVANLAKVEKFNAECRWHNCGLSMTPAKYEVSARHQQCLVKLYGDPCDHL